MASGLLGKRRDGRRGEGRAALGIPVSLRSRLFVGGVAILPSLAIAITGRLMLRLGLGRLGGGVGG